MSTPTATLYVQDVSQVDDDVSDSRAPAFILRSVSGNESGAHFEATVEFSTDDDGLGASTMSVSIANVTRSFFDRFRAGAFIRLEAGYSGSTLAPPQTIFYGIIDSPQPFRQGGEKWMRVSAIGHATAFYTANVIADSFPADTASIAAIIQNLCRKVKVSTTLAPSLSTIKYPGVYSSGRLSLARQISNLMKKAGALTGRTYFEYPDNGDPFHIIIKEAHLRGVDRALPQKLDSPSVQSAGLTTERREIPLTPLTNITGLEKFFSSSYEAEFPVGITVTRKLDPRITTGLTIAYVDEFIGSGTAMVKHVSHQVGGATWETSYEATIIQGDE